MSLSGIALVLFLTFHASMNLVALFSAEAYNAICAFLGSNWYAVAATVGLAALVAVHFVYAFWLTLQNRRARGNNRYDVTSKPDKVEWASQNMLVLGIIVVLGMALHLFNFWYNMMFAELLHEPMMGGYHATNGYAYIVETFGNPVYVVLYIVWLVALWFHLTHGFWSAMHTLGLSGKIWYSRWKCFGQWYSTLLVLMFVVVLGWFYVCNDCCRAMIPADGENAVSVCPAGCAQTENTCEQAFCKDCTCEACACETASCEGCACEECACEAGECSQPCAEETAGEE